jgi:hypothetical protein
VIPKFKPPREANALALEIASKSSVARTPLASSMVSILVKNAPRAE